MHDIAETSGPQPAGDQTPHVVMPWLVRLRWVSVVALAAAAWAAPRSGACGCRCRAAGRAAGGAGRHQRRARVPAALAGAAARSWSARAAGRRRPADRHPLPRRRADEPVQHRLPGRHHAGGRRARPPLGDGDWGVSMVAYGLTFFCHRPLEFIDPRPRSGMLTLHLSGMWVAFAAATGLIAYFVGRVSEALEQRERELGEARALTAQAASGWRRCSRSAPAPPTNWPRRSARFAPRRANWSGRSRGRVPRRRSPTPTTSAMIRAEVDRCTRVLDQLSGRAASGVGGRHRDRAPAAGRRPAISARRLAGRSGST